MFSTIADICSVIGLLLTIAVLLKVRGIHRSFLAQARLPDLRRKIRGHSAMLSKSLNAFSSDDSDIMAEIRKCHANLQNLLPKLEKTQSKNVKALVVFTEQLINASTLLEKEQVRKLYTDLIGLEEELNNLTEDMKWRERE